MTRHSRSLLAPFVAALTALLLAAAGPAAADEPYVGHPNVSYDIDSPPPVAAQNTLDIYTPSGLPASAERPVVVYVHGGGWAIGDKSNSPLDKARLFTSAGYVYVTINYRLSPADTDVSNPDPGRIMFPDHPHDVGEALGWVNRHIGEYGGDPGRLALVGHSSGAHLVSLMGTDPSYMEAYGVSPAQVLGVVSLDTATFNVADQAAVAPGTDYRIYWNAFGTPDENAVSNAWYLGSPINFADPGDPEFFFVTSNNRRRVAVNGSMAQRLGQDPATSVLSVPLDHEGINKALGSPDDKTGETQAVLAFVQRKVGEAVRPKAKVSGRPAKVVRTHRGSVRVTFRFSSNVAGARFECRMDDQKFKGCKAPRSFRVKPGKHAFRVRAYVPGRSPGAVTTARFRVARIR